jgi:acyl-coenzyme A synthetase/AMP-(fatty) acid ligase
MTLFWVDEDRGVELRYRDLAEELSRREVRHPVVRTDDPAELFVELLLGVLDGGDLVLLDSEFPDGTLSEIGYEPTDIDRTEPVRDVRVDDPGALPDRIEAASDGWTLGLYTSGTTGTPDRVDQTLEGLTRSVRRDELFGDHVWAFAYNPSHFAGLQVFFQAVMNLNPMVYVFERDPAGIGESLREYGITHVSATPTFYRLRLGRLEGVYPTVERLTSGGERFEPSLRERLEERFPNAEFRNVYALTEAGSLLESDGELFRIPPEYEDRIRVTGENELVVHESLLGESTARDLDGEWFHTGDLVEFAADDRFRFVGRESDFVNVGGYRVNPHEVEALINDVDGVAAAAVTARESSVTGHVLVAEVQPAPSADPEAVEEAVGEAVGGLERWKRPRLVDVVDELNRSRSGKRVR